MDLRRVSSSVCVSSLLVFSVAAIPAAGQSVNAQKSRVQVPVVRKTVPSSKAVKITIGGKSSTLTTKDLLGLPQVTVHFHNQSINANETYSGPLLADAITAAGLEVRRDDEQTFLHSAILATGSLRFYAVYSLAEVEPDYSTNKVILAVMKNGVPNTEGGAIELVDAADASPSRWVHGLTEINIVPLTQSKP